MAKQIKKELIVKERLQEMIKNLSDITLEDTLDYAEHLYQKAGSWSNYREYHIFRINHLMGLLSEDDQKKLYNYAETLYLDEMQDSIEDSR